MTPGAWDAVVVGGGPAGSATAARLAAGGHRVLLLDRDEFPRPKPCGECLSPAAVDALDALGALPAIRGSTHAELAGWRIEPQLGASFAGAFPAGRPGMAISRETLDHALLELARRRGAAVRTGVRVAELLREGEAVVGVRTGGRGGARGEEIRARLVIGADGLRSVVVRRLGLIARAPRLRKVALTAHVEGLPAPGGGAAEGSLRLFPWGCLGVASIGGGLANVTLVLTGGAARGVAGRRAEYFDAILHEIPILRAGRRVGRVLATGPFDWPTRSAVADGALLVGDAAGYYDPFTGQGIYRALRGAELAAAAAGRVLRSGDLSARSLAGYDRALRRAFSPGVRLQRVIETFLSHPPLMRWIGARLALRPTVADALVAVTGDLRPVRSLLQPRLLAALLS